MAAAKQFDVEKALQSLGSTGKYQIIQLILSLAGSLPAAFHVLGNVFIGGIVDTRCAEPPNGTSIESLVEDEGYNDRWNITYEECKILMTPNGTGSTIGRSCKFGMAFDHPQDKSFRSEFELVCSNEALYSLTQTLVFVGQAVGAVFGPAISDRRGRKLVMVTTNLAMLLVGMGIALSPNIYVFALFKFLAGLCQQAHYMSMAIFSIELLPTNARRYSIIWSTVAWALACMLLTLFAFLMQGYSWRYLQMIYSASSLLVFLQIWMMDESMRWLAANGKSKKLIACVKKAAAMNGKDYKKILEVGNEIDTSNKDAFVTNPLLAEGKDTLSSGSETSSVASTPLSNEKQFEEEGNAGSLKATKKLTLLDLLKVRRLFINAVVMWFGWFTCSVSYFTLYLTATALSGDKYLNYFLMSLMELPSCVIFFLCFNRIGRKPTTLFLYAVLGISVFGIGLFRHFSSDGKAVWDVLTLISTLTAIVGAGGSFFCLFFWMPELFPTNLRNQSTGMGSFMARVGAMLSPFTEILAKKFIWGPGLIMGLLATTAILLLLLLPETKSKKLPQTIQEIQSWYLPKPTKSDDEKEKKNNSISENSKL